MNSVKIIEDNIWNGVRLTTMQLRFHRFILPEFNTHRMFSRSVASNRAIPTNKQIQSVKDDPAYPVYWGKNKPGMSAEEELSDEEIRIARSLWKLASLDAIETSTELMHMNLHKQTVNRLLEPFQWVDVVVTATEWDNFFNLRCSPLAQPEIQRLACWMKAEYYDSTPNDQYQHMPYITKEEHLTLPTSTRMIVSAARCARVSYRNHDKSEPVVDKDLELYNKLRADGHLSPLEHVAVAHIEYETNYLIDGLTHEDLKGNPWSGNFKRWMQLRHMTGI